MCYLDLENAAGYRAWQSILPLAPSKAVSMVFSGSLDKMIFGTRSTRTTRIVSCNDRNARFFPRITCTGAAESLGENSNLDAEKALWLCETGLDLYSEHAV
jgi:hypothetical protein